GTSANLARGREAWLAGNFKRALPDLEAAALAGEARAQYALGYMYYYGQGVEKDMDKALTWIRRAANHGDKHAVEALSRLADSFAQPPHRDSDASPAPNAPPGAASESSSQNGQTASGAVAAPATDAPLPTPSDDTQAAAGDTAKALETGEADGWLGSRSPDHYTIQLLAARSRETLDRFVNDNRPPQPVHVVRHSRDGEHWLLLVMGDYADQNAARTAISDLPPALTAPGAWPRRFSSLQSGRTEGLKD
ncbi:MAG: SPOR domain-containing protein, partial [Ectothiorhodospiraceae bacterium]